MYEAVYREAEEEEQTDANPENTKSNKQAPKLQKQTIQAVALWLVEALKGIGIDIAGYKHEVTNYFRSHVFKKHGNVETEKNRGNVAITEQDIQSIPDIINSPDYTMIGAKRNDLYLVIYAKKMKDGTTLYFEEILTGRKNRSLSSKTLYKKQGDIDENKFKTTITMNGKTDISNAKIVLGGGGQSPSETDK
jgi:hypothetical protein